MHSFGVDSTVPAQLLIPLHVHHQIFMVTKDLIQQTLINQRFAEMPSPSSARHTFFKVVVGFPFFSRNLYTFFKVKGFPYRALYRAPLEPKLQAACTPKINIWEQKFQGKNQTENQYKI